ncbi:polysaccharide lyase family 8 super-sandwich domain-containing protein [Streptomyces sp. NPDC051664]|uniref:polysaccharide lyase family 8 super-sandwich domain-containing protein n=1 Tax=Streptomyces sp. NPDC051664 TaxID=3365668 RepID=UPI0037A8CDF0
MKSAAAGPDLNSGRLLWRRLRRMRRGCVQGGAAGAEVCCRLTWVGGTTDGEFAAIGRHLRGVESTLVAKESWFCLNDSIVCLGAGITDSGGEITETVVDNRNLGTAGTNAVTVDGLRQPVDQGWSAARDDVGWAHIEGHGGCVFPGRAELKALREERTGAWKDINIGQAADPYTHRYLTLWADHGTDPTDAGYAYILMPGSRHRPPSPREALAESVGQHHRPARHPSSRVSGHGGQLEPGHARQTHRQRGRQCTDP